jgi:hypothetical protein
MEDIYVVSAGARERLLALAEQYEEHYVVRAGLDPGLLSAATDRDAAARPGYRAAAPVPSGRGRE